MEGLEITGDPWVVTSFLGQIRGLSTGYRWPLDCNTEFRAAGACGLYPRERDLTGYHLDITGKEVRGYR